MKKWFTALALLLTIVCPSQAQFLQGKIGSSEGFSYSPVVSSGSPVTFDAKDTGSGVNGPITSFDYTGMTVGTGHSNYALVVQITWESDPGTITAVNWDNTGTPQAMTDLGSCRFPPSGNPITHFYGLKNPTAGNKTLHIAWTNTVWINVDAISFYNVSAFQNYVCNSGTGTTSTVTVTSSSGHAIATAHNSQNITSSVSVDPTLWYTSTTREVIAGDYDAGAGSVTKTATFDVSNNWSASGIDLAN